MCRDALMSRRPWMAGCDVLLIKITLPKKNPTEKKSPDLNVTGAGIKSLAQICLEQIWTCEARLKGGYMDVIPSMSYS